MININGTNDSSYRYKMPALSTTIAGKGNGIFTIVNNLNEVAKFLNHPPSLLIKFLSVYLGSMCNEEKVSITGGYKTDELQKVLQIYINRFVICPACGVPETIPNLKGSKKNITIELKCSACGKLSEIICNNKNEQRGLELIVKYLEKNPWINISKGNMVVNKTETDKENDIENPFMNA